ncbi:condensation domain-containing protein, partial [Bacillus licheniformis]|uniref:condensation domain-containing protein n=1 Tax=Bacillus licheniformis TaxID=1402 RepID=UPI00119D2260
PPPPLPLLPPPLPTPPPPHTHSHLQPIIPIFLNTLPIPSKLHPPRTFPDFLNHLNKTLIHPFHHHDYPFHPLPHNFRASRDLNRHPIFH